MVSKGKKNMLNLGDSDSDEDNGLKINKNYAERYDKWRGNEELQKLKDRYGDLGEHDDDESSSSSSEEEWTTEKEKAFFKTFSLLKKKDPKIYDEKVHFFKDIESTEQENQQQTAGSSSTSKQDKKKKTKESVFLIKDHERKMILEHDGLSEGEREDDDDEDYNERERKKIKLNLKRIEPSYVQEQESIKKGFSDALKHIESDDEGDDYQKSNLLKKRKKTVQETEADEEGYRKWLRGEIDKLTDDDKNVSGELEFLRNYWSNESELPEGEKFLRDYILDRKYKEPEDKNVIPSYDEIIHDSDEAGLSGDEEEVNKMEEFEHKYNFRFEEPDQEFIKKYPRTIESSLRRADEKRKRHREAAKERKETEKSKKREEIARLKALKRTEILEKIKQIEEITGDETAGTKFCDVDLEGDFDPAEHDRVMKQIFNEEYYEAEEDEEKPVFPFDAELDNEDFKSYVPSDNEDGDEDNEEDQIEVEEEENDNGASSIKKEEKGEQRIKKRSTVIDELIEASKGKRQSKKKKSSIFLQALERSKPKFDGSKPYDEYFDEYYKLDFEDLIGDLPCRFKYRKVTPNDFGLDLNEILLAPDRELNQWASLKKTYQYRSAEEEKYDLDAYKKKAANDKQKKRILGTLFAEEEEDEDRNESEQNVSVETGDSKKKRKKKNKKKKKKVTQKVEDDSTTETYNEPETTKVTNEDLLIKNETNDSSVGVSERKKKKKKNKLNTQSDIEAVTHESQSETVESESRNDINISTHDETNKLNETSEKEKKKKKKKKKNKLTQESNEEKDSNTDSHNQNLNAKSLEPIPVQNGGKKRKFQESPWNGDDNNKHNMMSKNKNKKSKQDFKKNNDKNKSTSNSNNGLELDDDRLRAYSINPTKYKKQLKYGKKS